MAGATQLDRRYINNKILILIKTMHDLKCNYLSKSAVSESCDAVLQTTYAKMYILGESLYNNEKLILKNSKLPQKGEELNLRMEK